MKFEIGYNIPAKKGMKIKDVQTPCLLVDLKIFKNNLILMKEYLKSKKIKLRPHAKMHKSIDVAKYQIKYGGAEGICCQKVSEAEVFARSGIKDILITNQVCDQLKIDRLTKIPYLGCKIGCCVDNRQNILDIQKFANKNNTYIDVYIEFDCGANRCGVKSADDINSFYDLINDNANLNFVGLQCYNGSNQHILDKTNRKESVKLTNRLIQSTLKRLKFKNKFVTGGGTGCFEYELDDNIYHELQVGSYAFMDAHYNLLEQEKANKLKFKNSLFILTSVMSKTRNGIAVVDAGLKSQSIDSGLPIVFEEKDLNYIKCSDEHGIVEDKIDKLKINDKLMLIPGHCDPTCNLHDWYVILENGKVVDIWPVSARGYSF